MDLEHLRTLFPVTQRLVYLNNAGVAPISLRARDALERYALEASEWGALHYHSVYDAEVERVRQRAAALLGADPSEIAFAKNTSEGLGFVAAGLAWRPGDRVVTCDLEYPSNVYAWWALRSQGVETLLLPGQNGQLPFAEVERALRDPRVRLLSLSSVEFGSGARNDLLALGQLCRERNVLFCVDAIQSLGCLPLDVEQCGIDFLAADGHKWLLSVDGCGIFYCNRSRLETLQPKVIGWRSVRNNRDFDHYCDDLQESAVRFEEGTPNTPGIFALGAALDLLLEIGIPAISERVLSLSNRLADGLLRRAAKLQSPRDLENRSGIVSFQWPGESPAETSARLNARGIFVVVRRGGVRASPHFYNTEDEIDALLEAL